MTVTEKHILKQKEILTKGLEVLCANGYSNTSVNDIVKAAGIPKGSFYFYFDSKEDFSIKALETYVDMFKDQIESMYSDQSKNPLERIEAIISLKLDSVLHHPMMQKGCYMSKLNGEMSVCNENIRGAILEQISYFKNLMKTCVQGAIDQNLIKDLDAEALTEFIFNSLDGTLELYKATQDPKTLFNFKKVLFAFLKK